MKELKCPKCGNVIKVDEADYAEIVNQVRTAEFDVELQRRMEDMHRQHAAEEKAREAKADQLHQKELNEKDKTIGDKENEILRLKEQISVMGEKRELELNAAMTEKDKEIAELKKDLQAAGQQQKSAVELALSQKEKAISELKAKLEQSDSRQKVAVLEEQHKAQEQLNQKDLEIEKLKSSVEAQKLETNTLLTKQKEQYESELKSKQELVDYYKDMKMRLSTKMVGESLEAHCSNIYNGEMRPMMPSASFEKDNDASNGSKGDFIFRDTEDGVEYISIMFEMKNEMDETATKHKNEDFFKKLDADRNAKGCEYAVLVSLLEPESELYNGGIVDVSYKYPKMYVIRPQFFKSMITLLVNAAKKSLEYKKQLIMAQNKEVDVTNFENKLIEFRNKFGDHYSRSAGKFNEAIKKIDETIKKLQEIKKSFEMSDKYMRLANQDAEDLTIRKLTYNNPTMKALFDKARKEEAVEPIEEQ